MQNLNWYYQGGALNTYGLDVGYFITPAVNASVGYYYQNGDLGSADWSGVLGRVAYEVSSGLTAGVNVSYDEAFETRVSADLEVRFGGPSTTAKRKEVQQLPVISALTSTPSNRNIRVHDEARRVRCSRKEIELTGGVKKPAFECNNGRYYLLTTSENNKCKGAGILVGEGKIRCIKGGRQVVVLNLRRGKRRGEL